MAVRRAGKAKVVSEDVRCFENPHLTDAACNRPGEAVGKLSAELVAKLQGIIATNTAAIDEAYLSQSVRDHSVYTGTSGIALLHYHLACTLYKSDPVPQLEIAVRLLEPALASLDEGRYTFLCGASGPLAIAALVHHRLQQPGLSRQYVATLQDVYSRAKPHFAGQPSELLYGHAGLLYSMLLVNNTLPGSFEDAVIVDLVEAILSSGVLGKEESFNSPMMFTWHHRHYLGAAHGLAGILILLLQVPVERIKQRIYTLVKPCVDFLLSVRYPSGNLPSSLESSNHDSLVHWCHGAPGAVHLWGLAYKVFGDEVYLEAALGCGEVVWSRGLLRKGYGLCHGVAGNAYTFIQLFKLTGGQHHLERVIKFTEWCLTASERHCSSPDSPYSLFEGLAGTTLFYCDILTRLQSATFPALELYEQSL